jgi:hypothetical protein
MIQFEPEYFRRFRFEDEQIEKYCQNALHDLGIARKDKIPEVRFTYAYQSLLKMGITILAKIGEVKVRSVPGHHVKILAKMSEILKEPDILAIGNAMRMKRNTDLYEGGESITEKEANDYLRFVEKVFEQSKKHL